MCADTPHCETPVGLPCTHCDEPIEPGDQGVCLPCVTLVGGEPISSVMPYHLNCHLRTIFGSVGHQIGVCHCPTGTQEFEDPPGLTLREAANAAVDLARRRQAS